MITQFYKIIAAILLSCILGFIVIKKLYNNKSATNDKRNNNFAVISCDASTSYFLYYFDDFLDEHTIHFVKDRNKKKTSDVKLYINKPTMVRLSGNNDQIIVLVEPDDTIQVYPENQIIIGRRNGELNYYLILEKKKIGMSTPDFWSLEWTKKLNFKDVVDEFKILHDKRIAVLDSLRSRALISDNFYLKTVKEVKSSYIQALLLPFEKEHRNGFTANQLPSWYIDSLEHYRSFFTDSTLLGAGSLYYRYSLNSYVKFLCFTSKGKFDIKGFYRAAFDSLTQENRDYSLFYIVKSQIKEDNNDYNLLAKYGKDIRKVGYIKYLDSLNQSKSHKRIAVSLDKIIGQTTLETINGSKTTWKQVLLKNRNNVVYADLWASWCVPCRKEMPSSKILATTLSDKQVKFVYVSIDDNRLKWITALEKLQLINTSAQHYRLDPQTPLANILTNGSIPKYTIINREGNVITLDAPRPSDPNTKKIFNDLLGQ